MASCPATVATLEQEFLTRPDYRIVPDYHHFSFIAPGSPARVKAFPVFCADPPGFDRIVFHKEFNAAVLAFLRKRLMVVDKP
jgi:predicted dienelactone hydrolase